MTKDGEGRGYGSEPLVVHHGVTCARSQSWIVFGDVARDRDKITRAGGRTL